MPPFVASHTPLELLEIVRVVSLHAGSAGVDERQRPRLGRAPRADRPPGRAAGVLDRPAARHPLAGSAARRPRAGRQPLAAAGQLPGRQGTQGRDAGRGVRGVASGSPSAIAERALPELTQIEELLRRHRLSWEQGVREAGLAALPRVEHRGLLLEDAVRAFIDDTGKLPRHFEQMRKWSAANGIAIQWTRAPGKSAQAAIATVVAQRREAEQIARSRSARRSCEPSPDAQRGVRPLERRLRLWTCSRRPSRARLPDWWLSSGWRWRRGCDGGGDARNRLGDAVGDPGAPYRSHCAVEAERQRVVDHGIVRRQGLDAVAGERLEVVVSPESLHVEGAKDGPCLVADEPIVVEHLHDVHAFMVPAARTACQYLRGAEARNVLARPGVARSGSGRVDLDALR